MSALAGISTRSWMKLAKWTVFGTLGCVVIAVGTNYFLFLNEPASVFIKAIISATVLPIVLGGPLFFFLSLKLRELAIANHRLNDLASIDSLTRCLNRGAFTRSVDQILSVNGTANGPVGALLVIDADHFKSINDRFGHHCGDEALKLLADAIRASLRKDDVLGRLGGEEFGVFLRGADLAEASLAAERIRKLVGTLNFRVNDERCRLSVSIGGAAFAQQMTFADLFRIADERLYAAKTGGRDRIEMICVPQGDWLGAESFRLH